MKIPAVALCGESRGFAETMASVGVTDFAQDDGDIVFAELRPSAPNMRKRHGSY